MPRTNQAGKYTKINNQSIEVIRFTLNKSDIQTK
jgi:hypothetical protein